jgi:hypothetical protein
MIFYIQRELKMPIDKNSTKHEVLDVVANNGLELENASDELKNDRDVVMTALADSPWAFDYASPSLQNDEFILRVKESKSASALLALLPLKKKLSEEKNQSVIVQIKTLISDMEEAVVCRYEDKKYNIDEAFSLAIEKARSSLEIYPESGWKKLVDDAANFIYNLLPGSLKNQTSSTKRFSFFGKENPLMKEINQAQVESKSELVKSEVKPIRSNEKDDADEFDDADESIYKWK